MKKIDTEIGFRIAHAETRMSSARRDALRQPAPPRAIDRARTAVDRNPVIDAFREFLDAGCRARAWRIVDSELLAVMIYSAFHGGLDHAVPRSSRFNAPRFIAAMQSFARRAIGM